MREKKEKGKKAGALKRGKRRLEQRRIIKGRGWKPVRMIAPNEKKEP